MARKVMLIVTFILFTGVLIYGAANRTLAKTADTTHLAQVAGRGRADGQRAQGRGPEQPRETQPLEGAGQGDGRGRQQKNNTQEARRGQQQQGAGQGIAPGRQAEGAASGNGRGRQADQAAAAPDMIALAGTILQAPAPGIELILLTTAGEVQIGTGPDYLGQIGFALQSGDEVAISGFWEDGEFKAAAITRLADGSAAVLRDDTGRPMWSGAGRGERKRVTG